LVQPTKMVGEAGESGRRGKGLAEEPILEFRMKYWESLREDASGDDSEDGEDDELPCVIRESAGDCLTRLAEISGVFVPKTMCSIPKRAICDFQRGAGGRWASKSDHRSKNRRQTDRRTTT